MKKQLIFGLIFLFIFSFSFNIADAAKVFGRGAVDAGTCRAHGGYYHRDGYCYLGSVPCGNLNGFWNLYSGCPYGMTPGWGGTCTCASWAVGAGCGTAAFKCSRGNYAGYSISGQNYNWRCSAVCGGAVAYCNKRICPTGQTWMGSYCAWNTAGSCNNNSTGGCSAGINSGTSVSGDYWKWVCTGIGGYPNSGQCQKEICPGPATWDAALKSCCPKGQNWNGASCITCTGGQIWDSKGFKCVCPKNKELDENKVCQPDSCSNIDGLQTTTPENTTRNASTNQCTCKNGATNPTTCTTCSSTKEMVNGTCVNKCATNTTRQSNGSCTCTNGGTNPPTCTPCPSTQERVNGTCVNKCAPNTTRQSNGSCTCTNGGTNPPTCTPSTVPLTSATLSLSPTIVNSGDKCTATWTTTPSNANSHICGIYNSQGTKISDTNNYSVSPGGEYKVVCTSVATPTTVIQSQSKKCVLNPTVIEI